MVDVLESTAWARVLAKEAKEKVAQLTASEQKEG